MLDSKTPKMIRSAEGSVTPKAIICLFDNEPKTMLARYISSKYGMTPERYREVCGLPDDYPMTAPGYSEERAMLAGFSAEATKKSVIEDRVEAERPPIIRSAKGSVTEKLIYCLFDGEGHAFPGGHVKSKFGMEWEDYLRYCGLPSDYPRIAPYYSGDGKFLDF